MTLEEATRRCIDNAEYERTHGNLQGCLSFSLLAEWLKELKDLRERTKWIPVTKRLPDEGERVMATHLGGINPNRQVIEHLYENGEFVLGWDVDTNIDSPTFGQRYMGSVIAWMPLPAPYEGSEEE